MMQGNYEKILEKIASVAGVSKEDIERRIEAKRAKLSGLISREGAAQVVAAELGVSFDSEQLKLDELLPGMRKVNTLGKIIRFFGVRTFTTKKGEPGKVANFILADETSNIKVVLWDTNHIALLENGALQEGSVVELVNASMRDNELHLGSFSELKPSSAALIDVKTERVVKEKPIVAFRVGDVSQTRAFIVQAFEPRFFHVCPECKKKVVSGEKGFVCAAHGTVTPEKRALITLVLDDGTENIRAVAFHEALSSLGVTSYDNPEELLSQRQELLGKEFLFRGNVRMNAYFNNPELILEDIKPLNLDELLSQLEK